MPILSGRLLAVLLVLTAARFGLAVISHDVCDDGLYLYTPTQPVSSTDWTSISSSFNAPQAMDESPDGLTFAVADKAAHVILLVTRSNISVDWSTGTVSSIAGSENVPEFADGVGTAA
eukprot:12265-Rhodomonas_salina.1